jgi:cyanophycin synthetase
LTLDSVPEAGREFTLRGTANVSTGGLSIDITELVHPDNRKMAERAAQGVGLDVAGIDFITTDITRSYREVGGVITELNARPGLCVHTWPREGKARNVAGRVLRLFYPVEHTGRIPTVIVAGDKGTSSTARMLDMALRGAGHSVALALGKGAYVNGVAAELSESQQKRAPLSLLRDPQIDTLVATVSPRLLSKRGLLLETCAVTVLMDSPVEGDAGVFHQGLDILDRATTGCFVVGSGNAMALSRLKKLETRRLILVGERLHDPAMQEHLNAGHTAVSTLWLDGKIRIVVFSGTEFQASFSMATRDPRAGRAKTRRLKNAKMYAIAAALGLGLGVDELTEAFKNAPDIITETPVPGTDGDNEIEAE